MANDVNQPQRTVGTIVMVGLCIVTSGLLMALRSEVDERWLRALIAGCAGGLLGLALFRARRHWSRRE